MKKTKVILIMLVVIVSTSSPVLAGDYGCDRGDLEVAADVLLVRPLSMAATILGSAAFIVSLPFAIPSGSVGRTARTLVADPFSYTFSRPIGEFGTPCGQPRPPAAGSEKSK